MPWIDPFRRKEFARKFEPQWVRYEPESMDHKGGHYDVWDARLFGYLDVPAEADVPIDCDGADQPQRQKDYQGRRHCVGSYASRLSG